MTLTAEQREERTTGLGGSDALAYSGKDPRKTPLELYLEKTGEAQPIESGGEARRDWGNRLEPVVRDWLSEQLGRKIFTSNRMYRSTENPFMVANLDGMVQAPMEGVEIKTADKFMAQEFGEVGTDAVPVRYVLQVMHYMVVTRLRRFHLGALIAGNDARHYVIDWDEELAALLIEKARRFWHHVETKSPPDPVTLHDADLRWPKGEGRTVIATPMIVETVEKLKTLRAEEAEYAEQADAIEVMLKAYMGDSTGLTDPHHHLLATWRPQSRSSFDVTRAKQEHPDLIERYQKLSEFRVFRLK